mmetsp:Transcript_54327/g.119127  ORF Transcript_54327/g.119127 Transcript_54327/m.119127 type:complete len:698 (+) Transcript_54327:56-2149(+)
MSGSTEAAEEWLSGTSTRDLKAALLGGRSSANRTQRCDETSKLEKCSVTDLRSALLRGAWKGPARTSPGFGPRPAPRAPSPMAREEAPQPRPAPWGWPQPWTGPLTRSMAAHPAERPRRGSWDFLGSRVWGTTEQRGIPWARLRSRPFHDVYEFVSPPRVFGTGLNGPVVEARHKRTGHLVAVKSLRVEDGVEPESALRQDRLADEISLYLRLDHPHIARLWEVYQECERPGKWTVRIVMECCRGGDLYDRLSCGDVARTEVEVAMIARQMLWALQCCHSSGVCHRDIKPENWVFSDDTLSTIKLIDFGLAGAIQGNKLRERLGSVYYVAPEIIRGAGTTLFTEGLTQLESAAGNAERAAAYDEKCDIWSLGVTVYMMISHCAPFPGTSDTEILSKIAAGAYSMEGTRWKDVSELCKNFIRALLMPDPQKRPSASLLLCDPFLRAARTTVAERPLQDYDALLRCLLSAARATALRRALWAFLALSPFAERLTADSAARTGQRLFSKVSNGGVVTEENLVAALTEAGVPLLQARHVFRKLDLSGEGTLQYFELIGAVMAMHDDDVPPEVELDNCFDVFDQGGKGYITTGDLQQVLGDWVAGQAVNELLLEAVGHDRMDRTAFHGIVLTKPNGEGFDNQAASAVPLTSEWAGSRVLSSCSVGFEVSRLETAPASMLRPASLSVDDVATVLPPGLPSPID